MSGVGRPWWHSPFGTEDQHGMLSHCSDAKRRDALALVREERMYDLGRVLDEAVPVFPGRHFRQMLVITAHHVNATGGGGLGENQVNWVIEKVSATTQLGTHLDMLNRLQIGDRGYNGWTVAELAESWGTNRLGAETAPPGPQHGAGPCRTEGARHRGVPLGTGGFSTLVHWSYGTGWGIVRAFLGAVGLPPAVATPTHFAAMWGGALVMLPALDVTPPVTRWGPTEVAIDVLHHLVYEASTGLTYELLAPRHTRL